MTTTTEKAKAPRSACMLQLGDFELLEASGGEGTAKVAREWKMLAHTGDVVSRWWGNLVLDLDGAKYKQKLALLKDHDTQQPIGYSTSVEKTAKGLEAKGKLLSNDLATEVLAASRDGFPWQASLMAVPRRVQNLDRNEEAEANGRTIKGPALIFREWTVHELTLTVLGADPNTTAEAFQAGDDAGEVQFLMTKTTKKAAEALADEPETLAPQVPATQPAPAPAPASPAPAAADPALLERERVGGILTAQDVGQEALARELIAAGTPLVEALAKLAADNKARNETLRRQFASTAAQPLAAASPATIEAVGSGVNFEALEAAPYDAEALAAEFAKNRALRGHFDSAESLQAWKRNQGRTLVGGNWSRYEKLTGGLVSVGYRNVIGRFWLAYEGGQRPWVGRISQLVTTGQLVEVHKWIGNLPNPRKMQGERKRQSLTDYGLTMYGEPWEDTVTLDIDDIRRDKTGLVLRRVGELGQKMASIDEREITRLLTDNPNAYHGAAMFGTSQSVGESGTQSNDITVTGTTPDDPTSAQMSGAILKGIQQLYGLKDERGDPMNEGATSFTVLVPVKMMSATIAALRNEFTSAGVSNTLLNTGMTIATFVNVRLPGTADAAGRRFYVFRDNATVPALIRQEESIDDMIKAHGSDTDDAFWRNHVSWGGRRIVAYAPGRFEMACRVNLAT